MAENIEPSNFTCIKCGYVHSVYESRVKSEVITCPECGNGIIAKPNVNIEDVNIEE